LVPKIKFHDTLLHLQTIKSKTTVLFLSYNIIQPNKNCSNI